MTCDQHEKFASSPKILQEIFLQIYIFFKGMLDETAYKWVGIYFHSMSWPAGTWPGLYKQIAVNTTFNHIIPF